jgi:hypothetical protein
VTAAASSALNITATLSYLQRSKAKADGIAQWYYTHLKSFYFNFSFIFVELCCYFWLYWFLSSISPCQELFTLLKNIVKICYYKTLLCFSVC